jgi:5'-deoxynucleotidase YfbR-like HD superfamily hydrolase
MDKEKIQALVFDAVASKRVLKTGYVRQPAGLYPAECDTVASHSHAVSVIAVALGYELQDALKEHCGVTLDMADLAMLAIFHDHGEGRSGDTGAVSIATYGVCKLYSLERDALQASVENFRLADRVLKLFDDYRKYATPEALIVRAADMLEGFEKALERFHNRPWVLDDAIRIAAYNIRVLSDRDEPLLKRVAGFLVQHVIEPTIQSLMRTYRLDERYRTQLDELSTGVSDAHAQNAS